MFAPAGMLRNSVPEWIRMGGRNQSESGAGMGRNLHVPEIIEIRRTIDITPIIIPSIVRNERTLFDLRLRRDMKKLSLKFNSHSPKHNYRFMDEQRHWIPDIYKAVFRDDREIIIFLPLSLLVRLLSLKYCFLLRLPLLLIRKLSRCYHNFPVLF